MVQATQQLEQLNETNYFKFELDKVQALSTTGVYLSIKKAFTPFAVHYMIKQMLIADEMRNEVQITEKEPFVKYKIEIGEGVAPGGENYFTCNTYRAKYKMTGSS